MYHEEILSQAGAFREGKLGRAERERVERHLEGCPGCAEIIGKWTGDIPSGGFTGRVMSRLEKSPVAPALAWRVLAAPLLGTAAAAVLFVAAFWHPERSWVDADKSFARFERPSHSGLGPSHSPAGGRYE
jgi:hypothetical protein